MIKEAFERGFVKAAISSGVNPIKAIVLIKTSNILDSIPMPKIPMTKTTYDAQHGALITQALIDSLTKGTLGGIGGAAIGGTAGYMSGRDRRNPEQDHSIRNMLAMGLLGGGMGAAGGGMYGANEGAKKITNFEAANPTVLDFNQQ